MGKIRPSQSRVNTNPRRRLKVARFLTWAMWPRWVPIDFVATAARIADFMSHRLETQTHPGRLWMDQPVQSRNAVLTSVREKQRAAAAKFSQGLISVCG